MKRQIFTFFLLSFAFAASYAQTADALIADSVIRPKLVGQLPQNEAKPHLPCFTQLTIDLKEAVGRTTKYYLNASPHGYAFIQLSCYLIEKKKFDGCVLEMYGPEEKNKD